MGSRYAELAVNQGCNHWQKLFLYTYTPKSKSSQEIFVAEGKCVMKTASLSGGPAQWKRDKNPNKWKDKHAWIEYVVWIEHSEENLKKYVSYSQR